MSVRNLSDLHHAAEHSPSLDTTASGTPGRRTGSSVFAAARNSTPSFMSVVDFRRRRPPFEALERQILSDAARRCRSTYEIGREIGLDDFLSDPEAGETRNCKSSVEHRTQLNELMTSRSLRLTGSSQSGPAVRCETSSERALHPYACAFQLRCRRAPSKDAGGADPH